MGRPPLSSIRRLLLASLVLIVSATAGCGYRSMLAVPSSDPQGEAFVGKGEASVGKGEASIGQGEVSVGTGEAADPQGEASVARVAILSLRNDSPEPWLDRVVSDALRREIGLRGRMDLVADPTRADYVLRGRILPLGLGSNSFSSFIVAIEYKVTLQLDLEVLRAEGDVIRLAGGPLSESDIYLASQDVEVTRTNRLEALRHLSDVLATRVADSVEWIAFNPDERVRSAR